MTTAVTNSSRDYSGVETYVMAAGAGLSPGDVVYFSGPNTVGKASNDDAAKMPAIGIVESVGATTATVRIMGMSPVLTGLTPQAPYYVGTAGALTATAPTSNAVFQRAGIADTATAFLVRFDMDTVIV